MLLLVVLFLVAVGRSNAVAFEDLDVNVPCLEQHLKAINFLESDYLYSEALEAENCTAEIAKFKTASEESTSRDREISESMAKCIDNGFKFYKVHEYSMKMFVYAKSVKYEEPRKQAGFLSTLNDVDRIIYIVKFEVCPKEGLSKSKFRKTFDDLYSGTKVKNKSSEDKYCLRKFVVSNEYVEPDENVDLNPETLDFSKIDCDQKIAILRESVKKDLSNEFTFVHNQSELHKKCVNDEIERGEYFKNFAIASTLKDLASSEFMKEQQRNIFVESLIKEYRSIMECNEIDG